MPLSAGDKLGPYEEQFLFIRADVLDTTELRFSYESRGPGLRLQTGKAMVERFLPIVLLVVLGMLGCKNVQPGDLSGTWVMTDMSRKVLPLELQKASAKIVLDANGTFGASDVPGLFYFAGRYAAELNSGTGVWKLVSREGKQQVQLNFQAIADWKDALPYGTQLDLSEGTLFYFLGDADEGRRVAFEKK